MKINQEAKDWATQTDWATQYGELEATCSLWIAANQIKDARISELEREVSQLRQHLRRGSSARAARLQRSISAVPDRATADGGLPDDLRRTDLRRAPLRRGDPR
ncbi:MAG: hypothetical protein IPL40_00385 [Proteobacteria bacterium]|nr:hypothetical protein [Pseudomonadota bacterium]